jgi:hypothetical protein
MREKGPLVSERMRSIKLESVRPSNTALQSNDRVRDEIYNDNDNDNDNDAISLAHRAAWIRLKERVVRISVTIFLLQPIPSKALNRQ